MSKSTATRIGPVAALIGLALFAGRANAGPYTFTLLEGVGGGHSYGAHINNLGQIAGSSYTGSTDHATLWAGNSVTDLGTLGGSWSYAQGINDLGQIVGASRPANGIELRAFQWAAGEMQPVGSMPQGAGSIAYAINSAGDIGGSSDHVGRPGFAATIWRSGIPTLFFPDSDEGQVNAINEHGQFVGANVDIEPEDPVTGFRSFHYHAFTGSGNSATQLGTLNGSNAAALDINNGGQIVGWSGIFAALWSDGTVSELVATGALQSHARAINDLGQVVGTFRSGLNDYRAALWVAGAPAIDLNSFLDSSSLAAGWQLTIATDINDKGWIVGVAVNNLNPSVQRAFLLTPVPEPGSYVLMLGGLGLVGWKLRRRRIA